MTTQNALHRSLYMVALTAAFLLPCFEWLRAVDIQRVTTDRASFPPGQLFYLAAKLLGMLGMSLALVQIGLSALHRARLMRLDRADHAVLGTLVTLLVMGHVVCFVTGVSIRNGHITWHLLAPDLLNGSYNRGVGLGVIALWLLLLGSAVHMVRIGLPRILHRAALIACGMGLGHALWIGTEKGYIWGMVVAVAICLGIASLRSLGAAPKADLP